MTHRYLAVAASMLGACVLVACDTSDTPARQTPSPTTTTTSPLGSPSAAAPPTSAAASSPAAVPLPRAADGTNVRACLDGRCEILVSKPIDIPLDGRHGIGVLSVTAIDSSGVDFQSVSPSGFVSSFHDQHPDQGGPSTMNKLAIGVIAISGTKAVIRLSPA
ncbi:hypothetical protein WEI85_45480 [Actinomycetes bacterium KLBMP 9797]